MKKIGNLIYWEMSDIKTTKDDLASLGIDKYVPRNDYKTSLIKALHRFTKGNERLYRRFNDGPKSVSFSVFVENVDGDDMSLSKEITIKLDKELGILMGADGTEIVRFYDEEKRTIDSKQLRSILLKCIKRMCYGISMRNGGGIYYVKNSFSDKAQEIMKAFNQIGGTTFHSVPIFDNIETSAAIEDATAGDLIGDIESLMSEIQREYETRSLTKRRLEGKTEEIEEIMAKAKILKDDLRTKYIEVEDRLKHIEKEIEVQLGNVERGLDISENFLDRLLAL